MRPLKLSSLKELGLSSASSKRRSKYGNKRSEIAGVKYRSEREKRRHFQLVMEQRAGSIERLEREVTFVLAPSVLLDGRKKPELRYVADFVFFRDGVRVVEDCKGVRTAVYRIKKHLMMSVHGIEIHET